MKYKCLVANQEKKFCVVESKDTTSINLSDGDLIIKSMYSGINYKDALGVTFSAPIFKKKSLTPGIDVAGRVFQSKSRLFSEGDLVLVNGMGLGESYDGGFSEYVKVDQSSVISLPKGLSAKEAMALGTSGFTAALAVERMISNGQTFEKGPIIVSGATGGVGQFAIQILNRLGFLVEAVTSRPQYIAELEALGAHHVSLLEEHLTFTKPLEGVIWGGAIDSLGGQFLQNTLPKVQLWGNVASIGMALDSEFKSSVMPFILRGVSLLGASSNNCSMDLRQKIWCRLATDWKPALLAQTINSEVTLEDIVDVSKKLIGHIHFGKTIVKF